ncbi:MAG: group II intron reverse transcriptase/maturase [Planctomycetota bacterium]|jgi:group II intron reverse transcriptase/maturase|nr:group II intron reverse transcriptase/maturase [Planctomycetota bacterium]
MAKKRKVHSLTGRITGKLMNEAFKAVKRNRGAAGIDKVSIKMFEANLDENLASLMRDLKTRGKFLPLPLRRHYIPKGENETRPLGIPAVRDRVAQEAIRRLLNPIFDRMFHENSFGFREGRNCHMAIETTNELHAQGHRWVLDADIKGFFNNIPHKVIMEFVASEVADGNILGIVERFLKSGVMEDGAFKPTTLGTPQGGVISPLLANIVLNRLDWALHEAGYRFVRYADDFVVVTQSEAQAEEALVLVQSILQTLGLELSPEKTKITTFGKGYDFLGFTNSSRSCKMRGKSVKKFKDKIREMTHRRHNLDADCIMRLNRVIRGTANYFGARFSTNRWLFQKLDSWIRMRLRCMKFKRKSRHHNYKLRVHWFKEKLGLIAMEDILIDKCM